MGLFIQWEHVEHAPCAQWHALKAQDPGVYESEPPARLHVLLSILQLTAKTMGLKQFTVLSVCLVILQDKGGERFVGNI